MLFILLLNFSLRIPKVFVSQILRHHLTKEGRVGNCLFVYKNLAFDIFCIRLVSQGLTSSKNLGILQTEFERTAKVRKTTVYHFLITFNWYNGLKKSRVLKIPGPTKIDTILNTCWIRLSPTSDLFCRDK